MFELLLEPTQAIITMAEKSSGIAIAAFVTLHIAAALLLLPCSPFTLVAGAIWGFWPGIAISSLAALAASMTSYQIGRMVRTGSTGSRIAGSSIAKRLGSALGRTLGTGWTSVAIIQGNPFVPAASSGYGFGFVGMPLPTFAVTTFLAILPMQVVIVGAGALARDAVFSQQAQSVVICVMLLATAMLAIGVLMRRKLKERSLESPPAKESNDVR